MTAQEIRLGLIENWRQFTLLVIVNACVGAMIGMERSILPMIAEREFHLQAHTAILSFIAVFGISKAATNYLAGHFSDRIGRKQVLLAGWIAAVPVPFLLMWAPAWGWILGANLFLGISQGLTWSTTVIMKIDLVGPKLRGLAMGLNEFAGYTAVALSAYLTGWIASRFGLRPEPFFLGIAFVFFGLGLSLFAVAETKNHADHESANGTSGLKPRLTPKEIFELTTFRDRNLSSVSQAGLINNLNDGMAWGIFPLFFAAAKMSLSDIAILASLYPATWGILQIFTGAVSDRVDRKGLIVLGMWVQALGIMIVTNAAGFRGFASGSVLLGIGTAMVYPTFLAAIGDVTHPSWRASAIGVYRLWRDLGYAIGAILSGFIADAFGMTIAMETVAGMTFVSGVIVAIRMKKTQSPYG